MIRKIMACAMALVLSSTLESAAQADRAVLAYYPSFGPASAALRARFASFNQLATDVFTVKLDGTIIGAPPLDDLNFARSKNMTTFATVSNFAGDNFQAALAHSIITSSSHTQNFISGMIHHLEAGHYRGLNVDFESVLARDRGAFTSFIGDVARKMHDHGYLLVVSLPAELSDDPSSSWTGAFDFKALGSLVDVAQLMTYDENGDWSPPGPMAGLDWVEKSVQFAVSVVPPAKISLGIPTQANDWDLKDKSANESISWNMIPALLAQTKALPQWDSASSSPYFSYSKDGHNHVVWYENARSLGLKLRLVTTYHLCGISVWALGMEDAAFWQAVSAANASSSD